MPSITDNKNHLKALELHTKFHFQLVNITAHVIQCRKDINMRFPDIDFAGLGVIDYESFRLLWDRCVRNCIEVR